MNQRPEAVICLDCGQEFSTRLTNTHLGLHGLTPTGYKDRHHLPRGRGLTSQSLHERISGQVRKAQKSVAWMPELAQEGRRQGLARISQLKREIRARNRELNWTPEAKAALRAGGKRGGLSHGQTQKEP